MTLKKAILPFFCLFAAMLLSSCSGATIYSDYREVADLEIIRTIGIDKGSKGVIITASTGTELAAQEPKMYKAEGTSIADALRDIQTTPIGDSLYFAHVEHIIIGEEAARDGIEACLDFVERISEMRLDTNVFIVRGSTAEELMISCSGKGSSATDMLSFLKENIKNIGCGYVYTCEDIAASLAYAGHALIMSVQSAQTNALSEESGEKIVLAAGFAVIKDGALETFLTDEETRGAVLIMEKISFDNAPIELDGSTVSMGINGENVTVVPDFEGRRLKNVSINISVEANIEEVGGELPVSDKTVRKELSKKLAELERERAAAAVRRSLELEIDFMDIGAAVERKAPAEYRGMTKKWDEVFTETLFNINVSAVIRRSYDIEDPFSVSGKEDENFWTAMTE